MEAALLEYYHLAKSEEIPVMEIDGLEFIKQQILENQFESILEIGTAVGVSALFFAIEANAKIFTIELDEARYRRATKAIADFQMESQITAVHADAKHYTLAREYQCDMLFIDAAKAQYRYFFEKYTPYLKEDGVIVVDNLIFHDYVNQPLEMIQSRNLRALVRKIRDFRLWLISLEDWDVTFYDEVGDGIALIKRR